MKRKQKHHTTTSMQNSHIIMAFKNEDFQIVKWWYSSHPHPKHRPQVPSDLGSSNKQLHSKSGAETRK